MIYLTTGLEFGVELAAEARFGKVDNCLALPCKLFKALALARNLQFLRRAICSTPKFCQNDCKLSNNIFKKRDKNNSTLARIVILVRSLNGPTFTKLSGDRAAWSLETLLPVGRCRIYRLPPAPDSSSSNPVNTNNSSSNAVNTNNSSRKTVNCKQQKQQSCQTTTAAPILSTQTAVAGIIQNCCQQAEAALLSTQIAIQQQQGFI